MKCCTNNKIFVNLNIGYDDKAIEDAEKNTFLVLHIDYNLNWKTYLIRYV
jgi:hypothetical protein